MEPRQRPVYHVEISEKASQDLGALAGEALDALRDLLDGLADEALGAVHDALDALETDPRPAGARRRSAPDHYSLRVGLCRIHYAVDDKARLITIQRIILPRPRPS